ncbi:hypothetical protein H0H81_003295 [Sphagnurus paluster]|uniref:Uncharacterized protein n=1 Tax=Sphagnurus paluster TaxID=117069 RepID=A0A9P7GP46_9AGAR|nr:hypothetical protein H0H81_003295 [Sphagnurus paluster]
MPEIEDEIFEWAARLQHPSRYAPTLSVVSKRIQKRVEPIIYETIKLSGSGESFYNTSWYEQFQYTLRARPAEFFARNVINMSITDRVPAEVTSEILSKCTGIRNLFVWLPLAPPRCDTFKLLLPFSSTLFSLTVSKDLLCYLAGSGYTFPLVTHLSITCYKDTRCPTLEWLPSLSSVELGLGNEPYYTEIWIQDVRTALSTAPLLKALQLRVVDDGYTLEHFAAPTLMRHPEGGDPRVSLDCYPDYFHWYNTFYKSY